jgi:hypothetical protein
MITTRAIGSSVNNLIDNLIDSDAIDKIDDSKELVVLDELGECTSIIPIDRVKFYKFLARSQQDVNHLVKSINEDTNEISYLDEIFNGSINTLGIKLDHIIDDETKLMIEMKDSTSKFKKIDTDKINNFFTRAPLVFLDNNTCQSIILNLSPANLRPVKYGVGSYCSHTTKEELDSKKDEIMSYINEYGVTDTWITSVFKNIKRMATMYGKETWSTIFNQGYGIKNFVAVTAKLDDQLIINIDYGKFIQQYPDVYSLWVQEIVGSRRYGFCGPRSRSYRNHYTKRGLNLSEIALIESRLMDKVKDIYKNNDHVLIC